MFPILLDDRQNTSRHYPVRSTEVVVDFLVRQSRRWGRLGFVYLAT